MLPPSPLTRLPLPQAIHQLALAKSLRMSGAVAVAVVVAVAVAASARVHLRHLLRISDLAPLLPWNESEPLSQLLLAGRPLSLLPSLMGLPRLRLQRLLMLLLQLQHDGLSRFPRRGLLQTRPQDALLRLL